MHELAVKDLRRENNIGLEHIARALVASGHRSLDQQAKALGLSRSTTWTIVKAKHKLGRLSAKVSTRIVQNPDLPPRVRAVIDQYLAERAVEKKSHKRHKPGPGTSRHRTDTATVSCTSSASRADGVASRPLQSHLGVSDISSSEQ